MTARSKNNGSTVLATIDAARFASAHAIMGYATFATAFVVGCWLHYDKICTNEWYGPPLEWMPSVSATIGDRAPEKNLFQMGIAACGGPRLAIIGLWYLLTRSVESRLPYIVYIAGLIRCGSGVCWMMMTSGDDHDVHDAAMFVYLFVTPIWMWGSMILAPKGSRSRQWKKWGASGFFASIPPMIYLFIQHKVYQVPGAYSRYAYFEWNLILCDVGFDASFVMDLTQLEVQILRKGAVSSSDQKMAIAKAQRPAVVKVVDTIMWRDVLAFLSESILGYCFFTTLSALGPCIFFFNVYNMVLIVIRPIRRFIYKYAAVFQLLSLGGLLGYRDDLEDHRLIYISVANAVQACSYAAAWHGASGQPAKLQLESRALGVGIIGTVVAKLANHSLNPAWPFVDSRNGGHNAIVLTLAALACIEKLSRPSFGLSPKPTMERKTSLTPAIGFGALLFGIHQFLSDSGSIIARAWTGYPISGPVPIPHGTFVVAAMALGLSTPFARWSLPLGTVGLAVMHLSEDWTAFIGGLAFAVFAMSALTPALAAVASQPKPALTFAIAYLVYDLLVLADVWTVAYAFVPGGWLLRERTDLVNLALVLLLTPASFVMGEHSLMPTPRSTVMAKISCAVLVALAVFASFFRLQRAVVPQPHNAEDRILTAGIWTVHFGMDGWMWESQRRIRALLEDVQLDVVGLLESDLHRIVFGNRDISQYIGETLGYYTDIGPGPQKHTWGAALLSKYPIINSTHHLLPSPVGELAPAIHATLDVYGTYIDVIVAHNGQEEDLHDRQLQSTYMGRLMAEAYPRPFIFLGYVVTFPHQARPAPYQYLTQDGKMLDIDPEDSDRWCEYIFFRGLRKVAYARITRGSGPSVTDTELQTARFIVPTEPISPDVDITDNKRIEAADAPAAWRYKAEFAGDGIRGHRYHVLGGGNAAQYYREV